PENLEALGTQVFEGVSVTNYILPEKVKAINGTFAYSKITSIQLNEGLEVLGAGALKYTQIAELTIPSSVIKIEVSAVTDCSNLTRVKFECDIDNVVFDDSACFGYNNSSVNYVLSSKQDMEKAITLTSVFNDGTFSYESAITLNYNGATGGNTTTELLCAGDSTTTATYGTLPTPTKTNYKFEGWYKTSDFSGNAVTSSDEVVDSHILYAKWSDKSVSFVTPNNGAEIDTQTTNQSETIIANHFVFSTNNYISTIQLGTSEVIEIKTQLGSISGGEYCTAVRYTANISGSSILIEVINIKKNLEITLGFVNTPQTLKESGANVEGIAVKCTKGGVAYYIADDFDSLTDTDTITFVTKQVLQGYTFSHWQDLDGNNLGTEMSIKLTKAQVMDNIITAVYVQSVNSSVNDQVNN
ncbi:MAG: leucine-rich repeat protein, partial [Clostridia bacterium]|nr:leucine-rich repeat protein [Clostridia bacterium]